ncbi:hypothetical protein AALH99_09155, partial [Ligilactobacillus murinus]|uniref:hypothetical protein n=1 Tax=Ligilactobacillus murinus TaxID=1622 RepID=UPI003514227F
SSKENLVIVKPPKLDSFVQLRGFTSMTSSFSMSFFILRIIVLIQNVSYSIKACMQMAIILKTYKKDMPIKERNLSTDH